MELRAFRNRFCKEGPENAFFIRFINYLCDVSNEAKSLSCKPGKDLFPDPVTMILL